MIRVLIVEDELPSRKKIIHFLSLLWPEVEYQEAVDGIQALELLNREHWDLVILDIQMPGYSGLEVVEAMGPDLMPPFIFSTAYDEHAVKAFELNAIDYLLKPFDLKRFENALFKVRQKNPSRKWTSELLSGLIQASGRKEFMRRILVRENNRIIPISTDDIILMEADDKYVSIILKDSRHLVRHTLTALETRLDPDIFARVHRSAIVNLNAINELQSLTHGDYIVKLNGGYETTLSRRYMERFKPFIIQ
jgi:two-component system, LytTR family, response regulator